MIIDEVLKKWPLDEEDIAFLLAEREKLLQKKEKNLREIERCDSKIALYKQTINHYTIKIFVTDREIQTILTNEKSHIKGFRKIPTSLSTKMKLYQLEQQNAYSDEKIMEARREIYIYSSIKDKKEKENISISNQIFLIDDKIERRNEKPRVLRKGSRHDRH